MKKQFSIVISALLGSLLVAGGFAPPAGAETREPSIVFYSNRDGDFELYSANRDGEDVRRLTFREGDDAQPAVSPNGKQVAFVSFDKWGGGLSVSLLDAATLETTQILGDGSTEYNSPVWSPDGKKIALTTYSLTANKSCISVLTLADGSLQEITCEEAGLVMPSWSPDGQRLLYTSFAETRRGNLYVVDAHPGAIKKLIISGFSGVFSPAGDEIAFTTFDEASLNKVFIARSDGSNARQITQGDNLHTVEDWAKDGYITFANVDPTEWVIQVMSIRSDGSGLRSIPPKANAADWAGKGLL